MKVLPIIYLGYMFISLYFLTMFLLLYLRNRKSIFNYLVARKDYSVSFIVPAYNEEETIADTVRAISEIEYEGVIEILVVNDCSTDRTLEILKELLPRYEKLKVIDKKNNSGKADSINVALRFAKGELIAVVDADSYPSKDSIGKMMGFFDNPKVGAVTCPIVPRNRRKFIEKLQVIEYKIIAFTRKLLDYVDAIYVTPGPLALYRKKALDDIGGFDKHNMTEDIEATWNLTFHGWERKMALPVYVTTTVPSKLRSWFVQRKRWNIGGLQCINKYKSFLFRKGMLGLFIIPFFLLSLFLGLLGLGIFFYLTTKRVISNYLLTSYSIYAGVPVVTMENLYFTPSVLNYLGVVLFVLGTIFTLLVLSILKDNMLEKQRFFNIFFYMLIYIAVYPFIMVFSIYDLARGKKRWR